MQNVFVKSDYKSCGWNFIERIKLFLLDLKCCKDRITKGYCEKDLWSIDYWFGSNAKHAIRFPTGSEGLSWCICRKIFGRIVS